MKLNLSASDVAESLKQRTSDDSANTKLSKLIDELDTAMGEVLGHAENKDKEHMIAAIATVNNLMGRVFNAI